MSDSKFKTIASGSSGRQVINGTLNPVNRFNNNQRTMNSTGGFDQQFDAQPIARTHT
jgi:hypothetical protein